jgi:hypothetical protein
MISISASGTRIFFSLPFSHFASFASKIAGKYDVSLTRLPDLSPADGVAGGPCRVMRY